MRWFWSATTKKCSNPRICKRLVEVGRHVLPLVEDQMGRGRVREIACLGDGLLDVFPAQVPAVRALRAGLI